MNGSGRAGSKLNRLSTAAGREHLMTMLLQDLARQPADALLVFHDQDPFGRNGVFGVRGVQPCASAQFGCLGKIDLESRSATDLAVYINMPAALLHNAVDNRQAESCALASFLRREEGLKKAG